MKPVLIVDGYNAIHRWPALRQRLATSLAAARDALIAACTERLARRRDADSIVVVFDGDASVVSDKQHVARGLRLLYAGSNGKADARIVELVRTAAPSSACVVVTDDNEVRRQVQRFGATCLPVSDFLQSAPARPADKRRPCAAPAADRPLSPAAVKKINADLAREWGLDQERK